MKWFQLACFLWVGFAFAEVKDEPVAVEETRKWDRGFEKRISLTAEELKKRQQAAERVREIFRQVVAENYPFKVREDVDLGTHQDWVTGLQSQLRTYVHANALLTDSNRQRLRKVDATIDSSHERNHNSCVHKQTGQVFVNKALTFSGSSAHRYLTSIKAAESEFARFFEELEEQVEDIRALAFELMMQKWQMDMDLRY